METLFIIIAAWFVLSIVAAGLASLFFQGRNRNWAKEGDPEQLERQLLN